MAVARLQVELAKDGRESSGVSPGTSDKALSNKAALTKSTGKTKGEKKLCWFFPFFHFGFGF